MLVGREAGNGSELTVAYELWIGSWETALVAVATATQSRTLSETEAVAHRAVIAAEREVVTEQFRILLGDAGLT